MSPTPRDGKGSNPSGTPIFKRSLRPSTKPLPAEQEAIQNLTSSNPSLPSSIGRSHGHPNLNRETNQTVVAPVRGDQPTSENRFDSVPPVNIGIDNLPLTMERFGTARGPGEVTDSPELPTRKPEAASVGIDRDQSTGHQSRSPGSPENTDMPGTPGILNSQIPVSFRQPLAMLPDPNLDQVSGTESSGVRHTPIYRSHHSGPVSQEMPLSHQAQFVSADVRAAEPKQMHDQADGFYGRTPLPVMTALEQPFPYSKNQTAESLFPRQENADDGMPSGPTSSGADRNQDTTFGEIDVEDLLEEAQRNLARQIAVDRERRGWRQWP